LSYHARLLCGVNKGVKVQACLSEDLTVKRNDLIVAVAHLKNNMKANEYEGHEYEAHGAAAVCSVLLSPSGSKDRKIGGLANQIAATFSRRLIDRRRRSQDFKR
jgi:hypothetical protein